MYEKHERIPSADGDAMRGSYLGPSFSNAEIEQFLTERHIPSTRLNDEALCLRVAEELADGKVVGWFQGRMEFGPRALGARSILGDARNPRMQSVMNVKVKFRESFRPFAPSVLRERVAEYFELDVDSPYMLLVAPVLKHRRKPRTQTDLWGIDQLNVPRSDIPAVTHLDYSARVQTVHRKTNPRYYELLKTFEGKTGCAVIVNTSFNVRGEPIVCTPEDAYRCFMRTEMDVLVLENYLLEKSGQPAPLSESDWKKEFELD
jgi:carbamoyltransferase